jgi:hypothetical protein
MTQDEMIRREAEENGAMESEGVQVCWDGWDDEAGLADYEAEMSSTWKDSEPDYRWMDEESPF